MILQPYFSVLLSGFVSSFALEEVLENFVARDILSDGRSNWVDTVLLVIPMACSIPFLVLSALDVMKDSVVSRRTRLQASIALRGS